MKFSWQGHRGCRGLLPENTIAAFLKAIEFPQITTLEMDVVVTADHKVLVSHEAWMNHEICSKPDGTAVLKKEEKRFNIYRLEGSEVQAFDCGKRGHPRFPDQMTLPNHKPFLHEVIDVLNVSGKPFPNLNIEIKTEGRRGDNLFHPKPEAFVKIVLEELIQLNIMANTTLQSFDVRILQEIKKLNSRVPLGLLVENKKGLKWNLRKLGFLPDYYNCHYKILTKRTVDKCHSMNVRVIPWTVNNFEHINNLIQIGVDGIITDYPNLASKFKTQNNDASPKSKNNGFNHNGFR